MQEEINYKKISFKSGIEIHQQLNTHKLFCNCPSILRNDEPLKEIKRKLHKVAGEKGEVDTAAIYQDSLKKDFIYQTYDTTCLIELDEEPPKEINQEALKIAMHISLLLNCKFFPYVQVMRKTVIDGSNTGGFQRTALIASNGFINTSKGKVKIENVLLEEDAARIIKREHNKEIYRLDRLGIPLVEIVTGPEIKDNEHAKEVALIIGDILRSCKVKRGLGTIRQDISISVANGERVELKGVQNIDQLPLIVKNEVKRQLKLNEISEQLKKEKINFSELTLIKKEIEIKTKPDFLKEKLKEKNSEIWAFKIQNLKNILGKELYKDYRVASELKDLAKKKGFNGLIHNDEDLEKKYNFTKKEIQEIEKKLKVSPKDSFIIFLGEKEKINELLKKLIFPRILNLKKGVLKEVRNALIDAKTEFMRPMPGSARMYPETDIPLLKITKKKIDEAKKTLPKLKSEIEEELSKQGLTQEMIKTMFKQNKFQDFKELNSIYPKPLFIGKVLFLYLKELSVKNNKTIEEINKIINLEKLEYIFEKISQQEIEENDVKEILEKIIQGQEIEKATKIEKVNLEKLEEQILKIIKQKPGLNKNAYMGLIMKEFKGKVNGKEIMEIINKIIK